MSRKWVRVAIVFAAIPPLVAAFVLIFGDNRPLGLVLTALICFFGVPFIMLEPEHWRDVFERRRR